jgi:hypothetical protein
MALFTALTDDFDDNSRNTSLWSLGNPFGAATTGVTVAETGNRLQVTLPSTGARASGYLSASGYDLTGSEVVVQLAQSATTGNNCETSFQLYIDGSNALSWLQKEGNMIATSKVAGSGTDRYTAAYVAATHAWLRIRHSGGTVYWDTAPSTASSPPTSGEWVNRASVAAPITVTGLKLFMGMNSWANAGTGKTAAFDSLNLTNAANGSVSPAGAAALALAGTATAAGEVSATAAPAGAFASASAGTATARVNVAIAPQGAQAAIATSSVVATGGAAVVASGAATTLLTGIVLPSGGGATALVGLSLNVAVGAVTATTGAVASPAGVAMVAAANGASATGSARVFPAGTFASASAGTAVAAALTQGQVAPAGAFATALAGTLTGAGSGQVALAGAFVTAVAGTVLAFTGEPTPPANAFLFFRRERRA